MKERNDGRWMEDKMAEVRGIVRDYMRMRNIKRATVLEFEILITSSAGQSPYLQEEEICGGFRGWCTKRSARRRRTDPRTGRTRQRNRGWT
jgi:hypothetical protein